MLLFCELVAVLLRSRSAVLMFSTFCMRSVCWVVSMSCWAFMEISTPPTPRNIHLPPEEEKSKVVPGRSSSCVRWRGCLQGRELWRTEVASGLSGAEGLFQNASCHSVLQMKLPCASAILWPFFLDQPRNPSKPPLPQLLPSPASFGFLKLLQGFKNSWIPFQVFFLKICTLVCYLILEILTLGPHFLSDTCRASSVDKSPPSQGHRLAGINT